MRRVVFSLVLTMLTFTGIQSGYGAVKAAPKPPAQTPAQSASDGEIDRSLKARLAKSKIAADKFEYKVQGGVVTWTGTTNVVQHKGSATRMARAAGAREVRNNIVISEAAKQKAMAQLAKGRKATVK